MALTKGVNLLRKSLHQKNQAQHGSVNVKRLRARPFVTAHTKNLADPLTASQCSFVNQAPTHSNN